MEEPVACSLCGEVVPLHTTYDSIYHPVCLECWTEIERQESEPCYGFFIGGDPRNFTPDTESCTPEEIALHKEHCAAWERGERPTVPVRTNTYDTEGNVATSVRYANYGIGVNEKGMRG